MPHAHEANADVAEQSDACAHKHENHAHDHAGGDCCGASAHAPAQLEAQLLPSEALGGDVRTAIRIMQMDCPTEEALIRTKFSRMPDVRGIEFNLMQRVLTVVHAPDALDSILAALRSLDFTPEIARPDSQSSQQAAKPPTQPVAPRQPRPWWPLAFAGVAAGASEAAGWLGAPVWMAAGLAIIAIASCGLTTYRKAGSPFATET